MLLLWITFITLAFALLLSVFSSRRWVQQVLIAVHWLASGLGFACGVGVLVRPATFQAAVPLSILGSMPFELDPFRGLFLIVTSAVYALTVAPAIRQARLEGAARLRWFLILYTGLYASMLALFVSAGVVSFIFSWEMASLCIWGLVVLGSCGRHGWSSALRTLAFSECGALAGLAGLLVLSAAGGSMEFHRALQVSLHASPGIRWAGFLLTFFGFGVKTGLVPVNGWMSDGYAAAPSHVRALFSGATLNLGIFAVCIIDGPIAEHMPWVALVILVTGSVTALIGVLYAAISSQMSRLLTHSSIENMGIVVAALGAGWVFVALHHPVLGSIALVAGLYHMINHSVFKTGLFLGAQHFESASGCDDLDPLGGLLKRMPLVATCFLLLALAVSALPPFGGFVSEWLLLEALLRVVELGSIPIRIVFALAGSVLALSSGLALTCFIRLVGSALLGRARSDYPYERPRGSRWWTGGAMMVLVSLSFGLGVLVTGMIPILGGLVHRLGGRNPVQTLIPDFYGPSTSAPGFLAKLLTPIGAHVGKAILPFRGLVVLHSGGEKTPVVFAMSTGLAALVIALLLAVAWLIRRASRRGRRVRQGRVWAGGLRRLWPEMQPTATGFAAPTRVLFNALLRPAVEETEEREGPFTLQLRRRGTFVHLVDRLTLKPLVLLGLGLARILARMHHGRSSGYAAYILVTLILALLACTMILR